MIEVNAGLVMPEDPTLDATIQMYNRVPSTFAQHFSGFRSCLPDIKRAHELAGVPLGESNVGEAGCGDGRDAETAFVPSSAVYHGYDPSEGALELARQRFPGAPEDMFQVGYAETTDYPEDMHILMSVNSILHVPTTRLHLAFERAEAGLRKGGVFYGITKVEDGPDAVEVYHDKFDIGDGEVVTGERTFYHHNPNDLVSIAGRAGLFLVFEERTAVPTKPWDWYSFAVAKIGKKSA